METVKIGRNAEAIIQERVRVVHGSIPQFVRRELSDAIKAGALCKLKKQKGEPNIFFAPDAREEAEQIQTDMRKYFIRSLARVHITDPIERLMIEIKMFDT